MERDQLEHAASILQNGGVIAHACEGVWGLACNPWCEPAVNRILEIKKRNASKGLIVIGHSSAVFEPELEMVDASRRCLVEQSWPGHVTWILPTQRFPLSVTGGRTTIAARVPDHEQARDLCEAYGNALVSTSANVSSELPALRESEVRESVGSQVDFVLPGSIGDALGPSEIRSAIDNERLR